MELEVKVNDLEETKAVAETLARVITPGTVILLYGNLGAGKTTFTQYLGPSLGVKRRMSSPTFNIIKSYQGKFMIHHLDCYRLEGSGEDLGFDEYFNGSDVCIIEWPQFIEEFLPDDCMSVNIRNDLDDSRIFTFTSYGEYYESQLEDFKNDISSD
ncbi:tRNA (adenosine(37)-N6)-threonylcarbamoyltransferase complex ATPase subunit type 1 TsaE [Salinicoccus albus]|uniref:tRNA (adenosine(37)-N6)-threonylcarbamoyltransferase complex ATPase subunit type 1 TsaE n=1 Tax=Salinicoccus albus TaxID=418756 RepID=UPI000379B5B4|nr:tRNA (adenosine(37)-N6)-threonylcarbamoyltransferase complex ATPase subunit type 1 TsaE [Salinicoccus albus]